MKKWILLVLAAGILFCSCSAREDKEELKLPGELKLVKNHFSAVYKIALTNKNGEELPKDDMEEDAVAAAAGFSLSFEGMEHTLRNFDKSYYYLKECLKSMEDIRLILSEDGVDPELINGLDATVNRLAHNMNEKNDIGAMRAVNDGIYIIGAISEHYDGSDRAGILRLEYCLNLLEIESENKDGLNDAIDLTSSVLSDVRISMDGKYSREFEQMKKSLESIKAATQFSDARLIRMKVEIMRDNLKKISLR